ncbi:RnfABCDGE type electron transport complex subunit D [Algiphilus sp.]|uniref:RnfABCDGE type electron transport complex subunit D n=1 Tax=Algiphilus sp. TaxID=1872431 RepID=UPI0025C41322|nr:RnfABCDGE type electron transport complex subunit D [Algiphilus sp.]MCK5768933.1 RnfABCDGE type electron transport complex subunit D [Algiphilus sp.]
MNVVSSPHLPVRTSVGGIMARVLAALIPGLVVYVLLFGPGVLLNIALCAGACVATEALWLRARGRRPAAQLRDNTALVTGVLLALALPPLTPWWIPVLGGVCAIVLGKQIYGGLGSNPFNPAMLGYVVLLVSCPLQLSLWPAMTPLWSDPQAALSQLAIAFSGDWVAHMDAVSGATALDAVRTGLADGRAIGEIAAGGVSGAFAQGHAWVALAWAAGGAWLLARRLIAWQIVVGVIAGTALFALPFWAFDPSRFGSPLFHVLAGATLLGACFIATDPVSAATTPAGRVYYGLAIGALTVIIRTWGNYPDAIAFAVLLLNLCVPLIDQYTQPRVYGQHKRPEDAP